MRQQTRQGYILDEAMRRARQILESYHPINVEERVTQWRQTGWKGYDPNAQPYASDQLAQDRSRYGSTTGSMGTTQTTGGTRVYNRK